MVTLYLKKEQVHQIETLLAKEEDSSWFGPLNQTRLKSAKEKRFTYTILTLAHVSTDGKPLSPKIIQSVPREFLPKIKNFLINHGFIEQISNYIVGVQRAKYIKEAHNEAYTFNENNYPFVCEILKKIESRINNKTKKQVEKVNNYKGITLDQEDVFLVMTKDLDESLKQAERINKGEYNAFKKNTGEKRLYSIFTSLDKRLRPFIQHDGEYLVEVDISASHPSILTRVLEKVMVRYEQIKIDMEAQNKKFYNPFKNSFNKFKLDLFEELTTFEELMESEDIYEHIATSSYKGLRNAAKEMFLKFLNDYHVDRPNRQYTRIITWFYRNFPNMLKLINHLHHKEFKNTFFVNGDSFRNFKAYSSSISHLLMAYEAEVVLDSVATRFRQEYPSQPLVTVHDSFLVKPEMVETIKELIKARFGELGISIKLKEHINLISQDRNLQESSTTGIVHTMEPIFSSEESIEVPTQPKKKLVTPREPRIRLINHNGTPMWIYEGTIVKIKRSIRKISKESFLELVKERIKK